MTASQKTPLAQTLTRFTQNKINDAFQRAGKALPCSVVAVFGSIVTVAFEINSNITLPNVTIPVYGTEYIRLPIQMGCKGVTVPADARLAGVSGIGGGIADLSQPANLTALVFLPIGNKGWGAPDDPDSVCLYGPNGVRFRDGGNNSNVTLSPSGIAMTAPEISMTATGNLHLGGAIVNINGILIINGSPYLA
jgi:hypothetical protein